MSSFWDSIVVAQAEENRSSFWDNIYSTLGVEAKPVKQSKPKTVKATVKQSKVVAEAEKVYETVDGLVVPTEDCKHHWMIPSDNTAWSIGVCKVCNGERWFSNRFNQEEYDFNGTLTSTPVGQSLADSLGTDYKAITAVYNSSHDSMEDE